MSIQDTIATVIREDSPRAEEWKRVFGGNRVPLKGPIPTKAYAPDGTVRRFLQVDVAKLTEAQRKRVIEHVASKFGIPAAQVESDLEGEHGLPILDEDLLVSFDARLAI